MHDSDDYFNIYKPINCVSYELDHNRITRFIREKDGTYKIEEEIEVIYSRTN